MRTMGFALLCIASISSTATAQDLDEYVNTRDGFKVYFPSQPAVRDITWTSQQGFMLPGRVYSVDQGREHYSVTVVDYSDIERMGIERVKSCPAGAPLCKGTALSGPGLWKHDVRGAQQWAERKLLQRDAKVTDLTWSQHDMVEGDELQLVSNSDQSRTYAYVAMHEMKLYIAEATVPKGAAPPTLFQTSMSWVDKDGKGIRYQTMYNNEFHGLRQYPVPPHTTGVGGDAQ